VTCLAEMTGVDLTAEVPARLAKNAAAHTGAILAACCTGAGDEGSGALGACVSPAGE
jgi:hypothetical protein